jgi:hypothetical protein
MWIALVVLLAIGIFGWLGGRKRRNAKKTGIVADATITGLSKAGGATNNIPDIRVAVTVAYADGAQVEAAFSESFSPLHIRTIGDRVKVFIDPDNPRIVYPVDRANDT